MIKYICKNCNITTELSECPHCGERTEIANSTIYWCKCCNVPTFDEHCPLCGSKGKRIGSDIRPVFPQERLLLEIIEARHKKASTVFSSQFAPAGWHGKIGEGPLADAILDRIVHDSYTIMIHGEECFLQ